MVVVPIAHHTQHERRGVAGPPQACACPGLCALRYRALTEIERGA